MLFRSLPGEYLAMVLAVHVVFLAVAWGWSAAAVPARCAIVTAAIWVPLRLRGFGSQRRLWVPPPAVTLALIGIIFGVYRSNSGAPEWLVSGPFSALLLLVILGVVLTLDPLELAENQADRS